MKLSQFITTTDTQFLISRVRDIFYQPQATSIPENSFRQLPSQIGKFYLKKIVKYHKPVNLYVFGYYEQKNGIKAFAKAWVGYQHNSAYYWLKHESEAVAVLNCAQKYKTDKFAVPRILSVYEDSHHLVILFQRVMSPSDKFTQKKLVQLYDGAISFIDKTGRKIYSQLSDKVLNISALQILVSLPVITIGAIYKHPQLFSKILRMQIFIYRHSHALLSETWKDLVHRDLRYSILVSKGKNYIVDWQTVAFSHRYLELAQLLHTSTEQNKFPSFLLRLHLFSEIFKSSSNIALFKCLSFYVSLVELALVNTKSVTDETLFINQISALN